MRYRFALLSLALSCSALYAQWTNNTLVNTPVRSGSGVDAATPLMSDGPDGSTYISWFDNQPGGYQLRMQRLDENGFALWDASGLLVSDHAQNSALFRYDLDTDGSGNAIVAFQDERTGQLDIVVYKISPTGDFLWGADGIQLTDAGAAQGLGPVIGTLSSGYTVIAWNANDGGSNKWIPYQLFDANGIPQWLSPQRIASDSAGYSRPQVISTTDGFILQYVAETGNFPFISNLYAQRYELNGSAVWAQPTHISTKTTSVFYFPQPIRDEHNGMYIVFNTGNPNNTALSDLYVQRVKADGSLWSTDGTEVLTGTNTQRFGGTFALMNPIMGLLVPVQVTNTAQSQGGWSVQRVDTNGVAQLGPNGVEVVAQSAQLATPDACTSVSDGIIVVYSEGGFGQEHVKATRLGFLGSQPWGSPVEVCTANSNKDDLSCGHINNNGQVVAVWQDDRVGSGIYAQNIMADGSLGPLGMCDCAPLSGITILQNAQSAVLRVGDAAGTARVEVFNAEGQLVWQRALGTLSGPAWIDLPQQAIDQGVYVVRFIHGDQARSLRWIAW